MKIESLRTQIVSLPLNVQLGGKAGRLASIEHVLVQLRSDTGHTGTGYTFTLLGSDVAETAQAIRALASVVAGEDPSQPDRLWERMYSHRNAPDATAARAISAVDIAVWDLHGRAAGTPVYRLLGGSRSSVRAYASYDLWESVPTDTLAERAASFVREGFTAVKIRTGGSSDPAREAERISAVRAAVGPDVAIMYDALQYYEPGDAIAIGQALEAHGLYWLEDPVPEDDLDGCSKVAQALQAPVACGEALVFPDAYHRLMDAQAADIVMVDLKNVGGITPWRQVAARAEELNLPVVSHLSPEISAHVLAAIPNGLVVEWIPWSFGLFTDPPRLSKGVCQLSERAGFGLTLSPALDRWEDA